MERMAATDLMDARNAAAMLPLMRAATERGHRSSRCSADPEVSEGNLASAIHAC
jgi:hypothetical protein